VDGVAVLFARCDSIYKTMPDVDVYDIEPDARNFNGTCPVVAHPPCRAWGRLRGFARPRPDETELAFFAIRAVQKNGGCLEHPLASSIWSAGGLPAPGSIDKFGGWTFPISQSWFGHRARKDTWIYVVGVKPLDLPPYPLFLGRETHVISTSLRAGQAGHRPEVSDAEREHTPAALAEWLVEIARKC
jgi:hypothetical protein